MRRRAFIGGLLASTATFRAAAPSWAQGDPLPSWNDGPTKQSIVDFVTKVTTEGGPDFVKPEERIATFDNDGTLWIEQTMYIQFVFAVDQVKAKANEHPEWKDKEPFKSVLAGDKGQSPPWARRACSRSSPPRMRHDDRSVQR